MTDWSPKGPVKKKFVKQQILKKGKERQRIFWFFFFFSFKFVKPTPLKGLINLVNHGIYVSHVNINII